MSTLQGRYRNKRAVFLLIAIMGVSLLGINTVVADPLADCRETPSSCGLLLQNALSAQEKQARRADERQADLDAAISLAERLSERLSNSETRADSLTQRLQNAMSRNETLNNNLVSTRNSLAQAVQVEPSEAERSALAEVKAINAELMAEVAKAKLERDSATSQLVNLRTVAQTASALQGGLADELAEARDQAKRLTAENQALAASLEDSAEATKTAQAQLAGAEKRADDLAQALVDRDTQQAELTRAFSTEKARATRLSQQLADADTEFTKLNEQLEESETRASEASRGLTYAEDKLASIAGELSAYEAQTSGLRQQLTDAKAKFVKLNQQLDQSTQRELNLEAVLTETNLSLEAAQAQARAFEKQLETASVNNRKLATNLEASNQNANELSAQLSELSKRESSLNKKLAARIGMTENLIAQRNAALAHQQALADELEVYRNQARENEKEFEQRLLEMKAQRDGFIEQISSFESRLLTSQQVVQSLEAKVIALTRDAKDKDALLAAADQAQAGLKQELSVASRTIATLTDQRDVLTNDLQTSAKAAAQAASQTSAQREALLETVKALKAGKGAAAIQLDDTTRQLKTAQDRAQGFQNILASIRKRQLELTDAVAASDSQLAAANLTNKNLSMTNAELSTSLAKKRAELAMIKATSAEHEARLATYDDEIAVANKLTTKLQAALSEAHQREQALINDLASARSAAGGDYSLSHVKKLQIALERTATREQALTNDFGQLLKESKSTESALFATEKRLDEVLTEVKQLRRQERASSGVVTRARASREAAKDLISRLRERVETAESVQRQLSHDLEQALGELNNTKQSFEQSRKLSAQRAADLETAGSEKSQLTTALAEARAAERERLNALTIAQARIEELKVTVVETEAKAIADQEALTDALAQARAELWLANSERGAALEVADELREVLGKGATLPLELLSFDENAAIRELREQLTKRDDLSDGPDQLITEVVESLDVLTPSLLRDPQDFDASPETHLYNSIVAGWMRRRSLGDFEPTNGSKNRFATKSIQALQQDMNSWMLEREQDGATLGLPYQSRVCGAFLCEDGIVGQRTKLLAEIIFELDPDFFPGAARL